MLARKYRPQSFAELIGQEAMVKTLANAIARDRLAHAFLMTGVRGVGKTSTARLIAKSLNCVGSDGQGKPTIETCGICEPCRSIAKGSHIDVIEMDAASHTGVDDIREINEAVRLVSFAARYKIYIIDEVHMLSKSAFNALLKTLEEPPPHVKFIFATTEVNKVPVTVLSRCQRFDLRRITPEMLFAHFMMILEREGVEADDAAIWLIASVAEGSVRDGLSILDQAIVHADLDGGGRISAVQVRAMLGLSDKSGDARLLAAVLEGKAGEAIDLAREHYALGIEPTALVRGMMELIYAVTLAKVSRHDNPALSESDRERITQWASLMGFGSLSRLWQLLHKGHDELASATNPVEHMEMLLLRVIYAATIPDPARLVEMLSSPSAPSAPSALPLTASVAALSSASSAPGETVSAVAKVLAAPDDEETLLSDSVTLVSLHQRLDRAGYHRIATRFYDDVRPVILEQNRLFLAPSDSLDATFLRELGKALQKATGQRWQVEMGDGDGAPSLREQEITDTKDAQARIMEQPLVKATFSAFPGAQIVDDNAVDR